MTDVAHRVLDFWFSERDEHGAPLYRDVWFRRDDAFDAALRAAFAAEIEDAREGRLDALAETADGALALVILLDQFPRNVFRGTPQAFAADAKAREVASRAIARGFDRDAPKVMRLFFYLPFEHSEDLADQHRCVEAMAALEDADLLRYAVLHRDIIARFGRFPHRNAVLGRTTTAEEEEFLKQPNSSF